MQDWMKHGTECIEQLRNNWQTYYDLWFDYSVSQYWFDTCVQASLVVWYWPAYALGASSDDCSSNLCQPSPAKTTDIQPANVKLPPTL